MAATAVRLSRRELIRVATAAGIGGVLPPTATSRAAGGSPIKAIAFDAFAVFDARPIGALAESLFPGRGQELIDVWRTRQFEYQWLRVLLGHYADFWQATEDALVFAAELLKTPMTRDAQRRLMGAYLALRPWPEAAEALRTLRQTGFRLALLSNATPAILRAGVANGGLEDAFEHVLSTDTLRTYKPDPVAYGLAPPAFRLGPEEILFVAFAGWDVVGAKAFGYPTFWVNRAGLPAERLGFVADETGRNLADLVAFLSGKPANARPAEA